MLTMALGIVFPIRDNLIDIALAETLTIQQRHNHHTRRTSRPRKRSRA
jgi:hypothetical protein